MIDGGHAADGSNDASITVLNLQWDRAGWPAAEIIGHSHAAFVVDACTLHAEFAALLFYCLTLTMSLCVCVCVALAIAGMCISYVCDIDVSHA